MKNTLFSKAIGAIDNNDLRYFQTEFSGEWIDYQDEEGGWTLLHYASSRFVPLIVKCLLCTYHADPNVADHHRDVALHFAALSNDLETLNVLLENKASPVKYNAALKSPLHLAVCHGSIDCANRLLPFHLENDKEAKNAYFESVVIDAVTYGQLALLKMFIDIGLDKNSKNETGYSLIHLAVLESEPEILEYLIGIGARLEPLPKHDSRTLSEVATTKRIKRILQRVLSE